MPIRYLQLTNNEIYHIVIRGVADSEIFKNDNDRYRAIFSLYEFNTLNPVIIRERRKLRSRNNSKTNRGPSSVSGTFIDEMRKSLVDVLAFCFMPNHIHLLLRQLKKDGITRFMRKFGTGYSGYFNRKYDRRGHLLQGRFKAVHIKTNEQLKTVFVYIHTNPISLTEPKWKEKGIKNLKKVIQFLENYKWSSYLDYIDKKNFPSVTERKFVLKIMDKAEGCRHFIGDWIQYKKEIIDFSGVELE